MPTRFRINANPTLYPTDYGGRKSYILSRRYRSNFVFEGFGKSVAPDFNVSGEVLFDTSINDKRFPGETFECIIDLVYVDILEKFLTIGKTFIIREGLANVGEGTILNVLGFVNVEI